MAMILQYYVFNMNPFDDPFSKTCHFFHSTTNWNCGLIGKNGHWKNDLLNLLCKNFPEPERIDCPSRVEIFPLRHCRSIPGSRPTFLEMCPARSHGKSKRNAPGSNCAPIFFMQPFRDSFSQGEKIRCMLAAFFLKRRPRSCYSTRPSNHL